MNEFNTRKLGKMCSPYTYVQSSSKNIYYENDYPWPYKIYMIWGRDDGIIDDIQVFGPMSKAKTKEFPFVLPIELKEFMSEKILSDFKDRIEFWPNLLLKPKKPRALTPKKPKV